MGVTPVRGAHAHAMVGRVADNGIPAGKFA